MLFFKNNSGYSPRGLQGNLRAGVGEVDLTLTILELLIEKVKIFLGGFKRSFSSKGDLSLKGGGNLPKTYG